MWFGTSGRYSKPAHFCPDPPLYARLCRDREGEWVGVELEKPTGKNSGTVDGVRLFECAENCGVFTRREHLVIEPSVDTKVVGEHNRSETEAEAEERRQKEDIMSMARAVFAVNGC